MSAIEDPDMPGLLRGGDLRAAMAEIGVELWEVDTLRLDIFKSVSFRRPRDDWPIVLVVRTHARNLDGEFYFDSETREVAMEERRFYLTGSILPVPTFVAEVPLPKDPGPPLCGSGSCMNVATWINRGGPDGEYVLYLCSEHAHEMSSPDHPE